MMRFALVGTLLSASTALAQSTDPPQARDQEIADTLARITQDPTVRVADPKVRALAQALLTEGVKQLSERAFDQALANFLEAYGKFPSPKILINIAGTLRDMGRNADAANTYYRYLNDPATGPERVDEVKAILAQLDAELTILDVRVTPRNSELSVDGGPFIAVGGSLITRVRPGIHLVRARKDERTIEVSINGFEGETKEVPAVVPDVPNASPTPQKSPDVAPDTVSPWLTNGTLYGTADATGNERKTRATYDGDEVSAVIPDYELTESGHIRIRAPEQNEISSGVIAVLRIDGEGRGAAGGFGIALARTNFEIEAMVLRSEITGAYLGARYRFLTGTLRPYLGVGLPTFFYDDRTDGSSRVAVGLRAAAGVELRINGHLSVQGDIGYEHFFVDEQETLFDANVFVPTLGVIGRL